MNTNSEKTTSVLESEITNELFQEAVLLAPAELSPKESQEIYDSIRGLATVLISIYASRGLEPFSTLPDQFI